MLMSVQVSICPQSKWVKGAESSHSSLCSVWPLLCLASPGACTRLLCLMNSPALIGVEVPDTDLQPVLTRPAPLRRTGPPPLFPGLCPDLACYLPSCWPLSVSALLLLSHSASFPSSYIFLTSLSNAPVSPWPSCVYSLLNLLLPFWR